jgi:uncharacterized membrane protein YhiD involved in acid resistance
VRVLDKWINESGVDLNLVSTISTWEMIAVLALSTVLACMIAYTYVYTHNGVSYSASFTHTIIFVGFTIALIMIIIGSNIARAFALVGAMSIIRFRNPVKDARDVAFLFMSMAMGMAVGTKFFVFATIFTLFGCFIAVVLDRTSFGKLQQRHHVLRLRMPPDKREATEAAMAASCQRYSLISVDPLASDADHNDYIYEVSLKRQVRYEQLIGEICRDDSDISATLLVGATTVDA